MRLALVNYQLDGSPHLTQAGTQIPFVPLPEYE